MYTYGFITNIAKSLKSAGQSYPYNIMNLFIISLASGSSYLQKTNVDQVSIPQATSILFINKTNNYKIHKIVSVIFLYI